MAEKSVSITEDNDPRVREAREANGRAQQAADDARRALDRVLAEVAHLHPTPTPQLRVTRTIVVEGTRDWVEQTLARSLHAQAGSTYPAAYGVIRCTDRKDEEIHD